MVRRSIVARSSAAPRDSSDRRSVRISVRARPPLPGVPEDPLARSRLLRLCWRGDPAPRRELRSCAGAGLTKAGGCATLLPMKTRTILGLAIFGLLVVGFAPPAPAQEKKSDTTQALLGTWDAQTEDGGRSLVFKFFMEKEGLKGLYTGQAGESKMEDLKVESNKVTFIVKVGGDQGMIISFTAFFTADEMTGMLSLQFGEANFSGKKRK
jgi:hypothetical protein